MASVSITELAPILICRDVQKAIRFYTEVLDFEVRDRMDDIGRTGWASLERNGIRLMLASPSYIREPNPIEGELHEALYYFYTDDVESIRARLVNAGLSPSKFAVRFYQMKEVEVTDPEGHVLIFGQDTDEPPTPE